MESYFIAVLAFPRARARDLHAQPVYPVAPLKVKEQSSEELK
jgi:hypothetical protein